MNERDLHSSKYMLSHDYHIFRVNFKKKFSPCTYYAYINLGFLKRIFKEGIIRIIFPGIKMVNKLIFLKQKISCSHVI